MKNLTCQSNPKPLQCPRGQILGSTFQNCTKRGEKGQCNVPEQLRTVEVMMKTAGVTTGGPDTALYKRSCGVTEKRFGRAA